MWGLLETLWQSLQSSLNADNVRTTVTALAFVTSFLTYILATMATRKVYVRLQRAAVIAVFLLVASLILASAELVASITVLGIANFLLKAAFVVWTVGLFLLLILLRSILTIDSVTFRKPRTSEAFITFQDISNKDISRNRVSKFGLSCVDHYLQEATFKQPLQQLYFPILLVAQKYFRPWRVAARFAIAGLITDEDKEGVIYFAFNQPATVVVDQLARRLVNVMDPNRDPATWWNPPSGTPVPKKFAYVKVIDCHSKWLEKTARKQPHVCEFPEAHKQARVFFSDPRDPFNLSHQYKLAVAELLQSNVKSVRVVYDSISDFLLYSDPQLAVQFIKHNMVWEDKIKANSLYVYIPGVPQSSQQNPVDEGFLRWNSYCVVEFKQELDGKDFMLLEGLFPRKIREEVKSVPGADYQIITASIS